MLKENGQKPNRPRSGQPAKYLHESDEWKRLLCFITEENADAKNRYADVLKGPVDSNLLDALDSFQNKFVENDQFVTLLKHDIAAFDTRLIKTVFVNAHERALIKSAANRLRRKVKLGENANACLQKDFNRFLSENTD